RRRGLFWKRRRPARGGPRGCKQGREGALRARSRRAELSPAHAGTEESVPPVELKADVDAVEALVPDESLLHEVGDVAPVVVRLDVAGFAEAGGALLPAAVADDAHQESVTQVFHSLRLRRPWRRPRPLAPKQRFDSFEPHGSSLL